MYGFIARQYLDVQFGRLSPAAWRTRIVGIEVFQQYRNPAWDFAYNKVHIGEAAELLPRIGDFDLAIMADVIEHFRPPDAEQLVQQTLRQCRTLIISTPATFLAQGAVNGNAHETHHFLFTASNLPPSTHFAVMPSGDCNIFVASLKPIPRRLFPPLLYDSRGMFRKLTWRLQRFVSSTDI
jgi:hypothetical protein